MSDSHFNYFTAIIGLLEITALEFYPMALVVVYICCLATGLGNGVSQPVFATILAIVATLIFSGSIYFSYIMSGYHPYIILLLLPLICLSIYYINHYNVPSPYFMSQKKQDEENIISY